MDPSITSPRGRETIDGAQGLAAISSPIQQQQHPRFCSDAKTAWNHFHRVGNKPRQA